MTTTHPAALACPPHGSRRPAAGRRGLVTAAAGYALAWVAGLSVYRSSTQVGTDGTQVVRALAGHQFAAGLQYALTEGVTPSS
jgi:hypothetical protein